MSTKTAVGYTRLSQDSDRSIDRQTENIKKYVEGLDDTSLETIYDDGRWSSGFDSSRSEWQTVTERVAEGDVDAVIADDKRRFARDFDDTMELIVNCRRNGVELHPVNEGEKLDLDDPLSVAIELVQAASEHEAVQRYIEKSKEETSARIDNGYYHGEPPAGLTFDDAKQYLVIDDEYRDAVQVVMELHDRGESARQIAQGEGVPWSHPTVSKIKGRRDEYQHALSGGRLGHQLQIVHPDPA